MNTDKRIVSGVFVGIFAFVLGFIQAILLVPILLSYWGNETYGIWLILNSGYIILQTLDSGHQQYIGNEFNIKYFSEKDKLHVVLASSLRIAFLIGIVQLLIVGFLILTNTTHLFLGLNFLVVSKESLNIALVILVISWISSGTFASILTKLLIPYGYYSISIWWSIYKQIGLFLVLVIIAVNEGSILNATIGISLFTIIFNFIFLYRIKKLLPETFPWWQSGSWKIGWNNFKKSSLLTFSSVIYQFSNNGIILLITALFNAAVVPLFSTIRTLTNSVVSMTNIIIQPLQPDIVKFRVRNEFDKIIDTFNVNWLISGFIINVGILLLLPFIADIYTIWTRGKIEFNLSLFLLLAWSVSILNFGTALITYMNSMNKIKQNFLVVVIKLFLIFSTSIFLSNYFGIIAVGMAIAFAEFFTFFLIPYIFLRIEFIQSGYYLKYRDLIIKLLPNMVLGFTFILIQKFEEYLYWLDFSCLVIMIFIYFSQWRSLPDELKFRIKSLLKFKSLVKPS